MSSFYKYVLGLGGFVTCNKPSGGRHDRSLAFIYGAAGSPHTTRHVWECGFEYVRDCVCVYVSVIKPAQCVWVYVCFIYLWCGFFMLVVVDRPVVTYLLLTEAEPRNARNPLPFSQFSFNRHRERPIPSPELIYRYVLLVRSLNTVSRPPNPIQPREVVHPAALIFRLPRPKSPYLKYVTTTHPTCVCVFCKTKKSWSAR